MGKGVCLAVSILLFYVRDYRPKLTKMRLKRPTKVPGLIMYEKIAISLDEWFLRSSNNVHNLVYRTKPQFATQGIET